ncbi:MAG: hypothetical protein ACKVS6_16425 [Planctomycetota bacterium]
MKLLSLILAGAAATVASISTSYNSITPIEPSRTLAFGPPLVCFQYDIGDARSLPWGNDTKDAFDIDPAFDVKDLISETLNILETSNDIIVHMETLRRAVIYSARSDGKIAKTKEGSLECRLVALVLDSSLKRIANDPKSPYPWIDAGYAIGASTHMGGSLGYSVEFASHFEKAILLSPDSAAASFAAAAGYLDSPKGAKWQHYIKLALSQSEPGSLVHKNIVAFSEHYLGKEVLEDLIKSEERRKKAQGEKKVSK